MATVRSVIQTLLSADETPDPRVHAVEWRLDLDRGFLNASSPRDGKPVVATVRRVRDGGAFAGTEPERLALLASAAPFADWLDIEVDVADDPAWRALRGRRGRVVSHHDRGWPDVDRCFERCLATGGDIVKVVATPPSEAAAFLLRALPTPGLAMGEFGHFTRPLAPWTYVASTPVAPGQPTPAEMFDGYGVERLSLWPALFGVAGDPIAHSQSPALHNAAFARDESDAVYVRFRVRELAPFWEAFLTYGGRGLSVTAPLKEQAAACAESPSPEVLACGAANTLLADGRAFNTDYDAYLELLPRHHRRALVLGAGGAARTAVVALRELQYDDILVWNRTPEHAQRLVALGARAVRTRERAPVVINTSPLDPPAANFVLDLRYGHGPGAGQDAGLAFLRSQAAYQMRHFAQVLS